MLYQIQTGQVVASDGKAANPIPLLSWTPGKPDIAMSVLCHTLGERPTPKQIQAERFRAARLLPAFRRQFAHGLDFFPGQQVNAADIQVWLRRQGAEVAR